MSLRCKHCTSQLTAKNKLSKTGKCRNCGEQICNYCKMSAINPSACEKKPFSPTGLTIPPAPKRLHHLQELAAELLAQGYKWHEIATKVRRNKRTLETWHRMPEFQRHLALSKKNMVKKATDNFMPADTPAPPADESMVAMLAALKGELCELSKALTPQVTEGLEVLKRMILLKTAMGEDVDTDAKAIATLVKIAQHERPQEAGMGKASISEERLLELEQAEKELARLEAEKIKALMGQGEKP